MKRDWKPGDVAAWDLSGRVEPIFRCMPAPTYAHEIWQTVDGGEGFPKPDEIRPLVVIDPEDREQVEAFTHLFLSHYWSDSDAQTHTDAGQAALRAFANPTPPRPEEPTGLGAVVEDEDGIKWLCNRFVPHITWSKPWFSSDLDEWRDYPEIKTVRVLSEGVTA